MYQADVSNWNNKKDKKKISFQSQSLIVQTLHDYLVNLYSVIVSSRTPSSWVHLPLQQCSHDSLTNEIACSPWVTNAWRCTDTYPTVDHCSFFYTSSNGRAFGDGLCDAGSWTDIPLIGPCWIMLPKLRGNEFYLAEMDKTKDGSIRFWCVDYRVIALQQQPKKSGKL